MSYSEFKLTLSDDELGLPALLDLCDKYREWLSLSKEQEGGRKTRSANKKADKVYEVIMNYTLPPIKLKPHVTIAPQYSNDNLSRDVSMDSTVSSDNGDSSSSTRPMTRSLRPRCRTPSSSARSVTPTTPQNQRLRANLKQQPSTGSSTSGSSSNVLANNSQKHPSVSVTKIRQLLRADSAQKKREQERERQDRIRLERKVKEERAEAQKKQLLEERAVTAKQKREQRLLHAAEVRKAREATKNQRVKYIDHEMQHEPQPSKLQPSPQHQHKHQPPAPPAPQPPPVNKPEPQQVQKPEPQTKKPADPAVLNETFKKNDINNIEIVINDTGTSINSVRDAPVIATWARAPHLRKALVEQYTNPSLKPNIKATHLMPVDLERILGKSVGSRHLHRTSSGVWTPPRKSIRRSNSIVSTPTQ